MGGWVVCVSGFRMRCWTLWVGGWVWVGGWGDLEEEEEVGGWEGELPHK